jgi:calcineurin-like phosphoesterase
MKLLFVGDVIGKPGRRVLADRLTGLIDRHRIDYVVVNIENSAGGFGITAAVLEELEALPIDCYTSGNHIWDKRDSLGLLDQEAKLLRPANYPAGNHGHGLYVGETASGIKVATLNLEGQVFMKALPSPLRGGRSRACLPAAGRAGGAGRFPRRGDQ